MNLDKVDRPNYVFEKGDIADYGGSGIFEQYEPDLVIHFAAKATSAQYRRAGRMRTNITGTFNLLEACRLFWGQKEELFHHVSTTRFTAPSATGFFINYTL